MSVKLHLVFFHCLGQDNAGKTTCNSGSGCVWRQDPSRAGKLSILLDGLRHEDLVVNCALIVNEANDVCLKGESLHTSLAQETLNVVL